MPWPPTIKLLLLGLVSTQRSMECHASVQETLARDPAPLVSLLKSEERPLLLSARCVDESSHTHQEQKRPSPLRTTHPQGARMVQSSWSWNLQKSVTSWLRASRMLKSINCELKPLKRDKKNLETKKSPLSLLRSQDSKRPFLLQGSRSSHR